MTIKQIDCEYNKRHSKLKIRCFKMPNASYTYPSTKKSRTKKSALLLRMYENLNLSIR